MANACAAALRARLAEAGTWLSRLDLSTALGGAWSEAQVDDELADMVIAGDVQFHERGRMYRLAGDPLARAALQQMLLDDVNAAITGRASRDGATYRIGIARRVNPGQAGEAVAVATLEMPYPPEGPAALAKLPGLLLQQPTVAAAT